MRTMDSRKTVSPARSTVSLSGEARQTIDMLIHSSAQLLTLAGGPQRGNTLGNLGLLPGGAVAIHMGKIVETGPSTELLTRYTAAVQIDASGRVVMPGYGLELDTELRMLEAILILAEDEGPTLVPTFLGAHAVPAEFSGRSDAYTDLVFQEMLPRVKEWWIEQAASRPLPFVDVFCEEGAFNLDQSRRILERAAELGFPLKIHADEFAGLGGTRLAVELGAVSADHLVHTPAEDIAALGGSNTVAVALPATPFGLGESAYTPGRQILEAGGTLALASDLNPGTAWCENMQFIIALACRSMRLTPAEAIAAATVNAAAAVGLSDHVGSLEAGKAADLIVLDASDYHHLGYRFGTNLVSLVVKGGRQVSVAGG